MKTWFSFSIYHNQLNEILKHPVLTTINSLQYDGSVAKFIFNRSWDRGENLLLLLKYNNPADEIRINELINSSVIDYMVQHPAPEKKNVFPINDWFVPFPNNHIEYKNNFIFDVMETGGLQASTVAEDIFCDSSLLIGKMIIEADGAWDIESAFVPTLQFNLILSCFFNKNVADLKSFYSYLFETILKSSNINDDESAKISLLQEFEDNFQSQQEGLVGFINYVVECVHANEHFDEEWINQWAVSSNEAAQLINQIQESNKYIVPENFSLNSSISTIAATQEKWPTLAYYIRFINCQIGISGVYELNLIYTLKRSIETILNEHTINEKIN